MDLHSTLQIASLGAGLQRLNEHDVSRSDRMVVLRRNEQLQRLVKLFLLIEHLHLLSDGGHGLMRHRTSEHSIQ